MPLSNGQYSAPIPFIRFLDTVGDGSGIINGIGNYSGVATTFKLKPPAGLIFVVNKFQIHIADSGNFTANGYGSIASGVIVNGLILQAVINGVTYSFTGPSPIMDNTDHLHLSDYYLLQTYAGAGGNSSLTTFNAKDFGVPLTLNGSTGDSLQVILHDNFTGLLDHHFIAKGYF